MSSGCSFAFSRGPPKPRRVLVSNPFPMSEIVNPYYGCDLLSLDVSAFQGRAARAAARPAVGWGSTSMAGSSGEHPSRCAELSHCTAGTRCTEPLASGVLKEPKDTSPLSPVHLPAASTPRGEIPVPLQLLPWGGCAVRCLVGRSPSFCWFCRGILLMEEEFYGAVLSMHKLPSIFPILN